MSKQRRRKSEGEITIGGSVSGIGNVVGHGSSSQTQIHLQGPDSPLPSPQPGTPSQSGVKWARLAAFLLALAGILAAIALFLRLLHSFETAALVQLILASLVTALGVAGIIKPQMLADLLGKALRK